MLPRGRDRGVGTVEGGLGADPQQVDAVPGREAEEPRAGARVAAAAEVPVGRGGQEPLRRHRVPAALPLPGAAVKGRKTTFDLPAVGSAHARVPLCACAGFRACAVKARRPQWRRPWRVSEGRLGKTLGGGFEAHVGLCFVFLFVQASLGRGGCSSGPGRRGESIPAPHLVCPQCGRGERLHFDVEAECKL